MAPCQPNDALACSDVDGFPVGRLADCSALGTDCLPTFALAQTALDRHDPSHRPVARDQLFRVDMAKVCGPQRCGFSGGHAIVVFTFADGSYRAIGIDCPGIAPCGATLRRGNDAGGVELPSPYPLAGGAVQDLNAPSRRRAAVALALLAVALLIVLRYGGSAGLTQVPG
jgi:hypothetical protein